MDDDISYYRRREADARALASGCDDHQIARIHHDMADRYAERVRQLSTEPDDPVVA